MFRKILIVVEIESKVCFSFQRSFRLCSCLKNEFDLFDCSLEYCVELERRELEL